MRIMGIDPGSLCMGYGIIDEKERALGWGRITVPGKMPMEKRAAEFFSAVGELVKKEEIEVVAIEEVFYGKDVKPLLKLAHCRGAVMASLALHGVPVYEYSPAEVKQAVVGYGRAAKEQVKMLVKQLLGIDDELTSDEADALAVALCYNQREGLRRALGNASQS